MLKRTALAGAGVVAAPMINRGSYRIFTGLPGEDSGHAIDFISQTTVIDMLSPLTFDFDKQAKLFKNSERFTTSDLKPYLASGINIFHPAVGMGGPAAYENVLQFFASWNGFIANGDEHFMRIDSVTDLKRVKKSGKIGIMLGLQNSDHFRRP